MKIEDPHIRRFVYGFVITSILLSTIALIHAAIKTMLIGAIVWMPIYYLAGYIYELYKKRDEL